MHILYINLDGRPDRRIHCEHELAKLDIPDKHITRLPAVKVPDARVGCSMSHLRALRMARDLGWPEVMIVEDDIRFTQPEWYSAALRAVLDSPDAGFDVLLLAGNLAKHLADAQTHPNSHPIAAELPGAAALTPQPTLHKVTRCWTTTGYIVKAHFYDTLIDNVSDGIKRLLNSPHFGSAFCIDVYWQHLMPYSEFLIVAPRTVSQLHAFSDIERKVVDYDWLMLDSAHSVP